MDRFFNLNTLILFLALLLNSSLVFADVDCSNKQLYYEGSCNNQCVTPETCEPDFQDSAIFCCGNPASVPELPSWFGPFFLATVVAGWEYLRIHRRKASTLKAVKKD